MCPSARSQRNLQRGDGSGVDQWSDIYGDGPGGAAVSGPLHTRRRRDVTPAANSHTALSTLQRSPPGDDLAHSRWRPTTCGRLQRLRPFCRGIHGACKRPPACHWPVLTATFNEPMTPDTLDAASFTVTLAESPYREPSRIRVWLRRSRRLPTELQHRLHSNYYHWGL